jgi:transmembrane sensor
MDNESSLFMKPQWERMMQQESDVPVNHTLWEKIKLAIEDQEKAATQRRLKIYTWGIRIAAVLVLGLLVSNLVFMQNAKQPEIFVQTQSVSVPHGARTSFALPDGSVVWLNSGFGTPILLNFQITVALNWKGKPILKSKNRKSRLR